MIRLPLVLPRLHFSSTNLMGRSIVTSFCLRTLWVRSLKKQKKKQNISSSFPVVAKKVRYKQRKKCVAYHPGREKLSYMVVLPLVIKHTQTQTYFSLDFLFSLKRQFLKVDTLWLSPSFPFSKYMESQPGAGELVGFTQGYGISPPEEKKVRK